MPELLEPVAATKPLDKIEADDLMEAGKVEWKLIPGGIERRLAAVHLDRFEITELQRQQASLSAKLAQVNEALAKIAELSK